VVEYVAARSPKAAAGLLGKLRRRARSLGTAPLRGRIVPELAEIGVTIFRELLEPPYRILYRVAEKEVFVLGVLDGRRDLEDLLLERLIRQP
jgi:plasmid stabilization system protein ParE